MHTEYPEGVKRVVCVRSEARKGMKHYGYFLVEMYLENTVEETMGMVSDLSVSYPSQCVVLQKLGHVRDRDSRAPFSLKHLDEKNLDLDKVYILHGPSLKHWRNKSVTSRMRSHIESDYLAMLPWFPNKPRRIDYAWFGTVHEFMTYAVWADRWRVTHGLKMESEASREIVEQYEVLKELGVR